jgi:hypothetical protein
MSTPGLKTWMGLVLGGLWLISLAVVPAEPEVSLSLGSLSAESWSAEGVEMQLGITQTGVGVRLSVQRLRHAAIPGDLLGVVLDCNALIENLDGYRCDDARLSIRKSAYGPQEAKLSGRYARSGEYSLKTHGLKLFGGMVSVNIRGSGIDWKMDVRATKLGLEAVTAVYPEVMPKGSSLSGQAGIHLQLHGDVQGPVAIQGDGQLDSLNYSDDSGLHVAEGGRAHWGMDAKRRDTAWKGRVDLQVDSGMFYSDPFYLEVSQAPLKLHLRGDWSPDQQRVRLDDAELVLTPVIQAQGQGVIDLAQQQIDEARLQLSSQGLQEFYKTLLQPMLIGSRLDELAVNGGFEADIQLRDNQLSGLDARLSGVSIADHKEGFSAQELQGRLIWPHRDASPASELRLAGGALYGIPLGPMQVRFEMSEAAFRLLEPLSIPLLQGRLNIDRFDARDPFGKSPVWQTGAKLVDLSLAELTRAFGWPEMSGSLNGTLPAMSYQDHTLTLDGALQVDVFDGHVRVDDLVIRNPFGRVPELFADAQFQQLDLAPITRTFSFGHMEGGLEGWVRDLHLMSWEPVSFQALLQTPRDDPLSHRISQRAIDDLTTLGNGVGSGLSKTFMGIFKEFRYNRMMLRVTLSGDQAELDGIPHDDDGYYLVKGSGLPRIDVIARNRNVAWKTLLARLRNIRVEGMQMQ